MAPLLDIRDLTLDFVTRDGGRRVLDGLDLQVGEAEVLGLVGESGSGKTVTGLATLGLLGSSARYPRGRIDFAGEDLLAMAPAARRALRGRKIAMIFQDPMTGLNPFMRVGRQITEVLRRSDSEKPLSRKAAEHRAAELLGEMGLAGPEALLRVFPHELSGGMRQRVMIAMALALEPDLLFADEPTTALDVTTQAQILALLAQLRERFRTSIVFVTHDLAAIAGLADRIAVMYAGRVVETSSADHFYSDCRHPYSKALLASSPSLQGERPERLLTVEGAPPTPRSLAEIEDLESASSSCSFAPRCAYRRDDLACDEERPPLRARA